MAKPARVGQGWQRRFLGLILAWALLAPGGAGALPPPVPAARDLAVDARAAPVGQPFVLVFSRRQCGWCEKARVEHLNALAADPHSGARFRQVEADADAPLVDFAGRRTTHRAFAAALNVKLTPSLHFVAADGRPLADPIVGYRLPEFYGTLIERAIESSRRHLLGEGHEQPR
jgi:hypothetical protein